MRTDPFQAKGSFTTSQGEITIWRLAALEQAGLTKLERLPYSIRILLESVLRQVNDREIWNEDVENLAHWSAHQTNRSNLPFLPSRVIMQDFTGVPALVDLAAMRSALTRFGGDPGQINPMVPVDLVIDHSVQVDFFATPEALQRNADIEFQRNRERYEFLRWGKEAFDQLRVVPPATGIVHQVNLEYLAGVVQLREDQGDRIAYPDTVVGTDSHTTMVNALGVLGWGVGGIEAEATILSQPLVMVAPDVVGFQLTGKLREGVTATDLVLTITQILRGKGVVGKFVEYFGPGLEYLTLPDRATIANMAPEYGATVGFFPVDDETIRYLRQTGREDSLVDLVERYSKEQGLFRTASSPTPEYTDTVDLDLSEVETSLAGPRRPQDRVPLGQVGAAFRSALERPKAEGGFGTSSTPIGNPKLHTNGHAVEVDHGLITIAAITSCTNTSNPALMIAAGLLARNALHHGLRVPPYVKTSLAPGSTVVTEYLNKSGLLEPLAELGFNIVGYGCTTCIGNSGPLPGEVVKVINEADLVAAAVLSGNRNFEGRINPHVRANYLASPPLVVAFALAGSMQTNMVEDPLGMDEEGNPVYLRDIWPAPDEVQATIDAALSPDLFRSRYSDVFDGNPTWNQIAVSGGELFEWNPESTYIQEPPFFLDLSKEIPPVSDIVDARVLAILGDSVTTDHISPAGAIPAESPAGRYLIEREVQPRDFNSFGSRRGNDRVMTRGTFGNIRLKNLLVPGVEGGFTRHFPSGDELSIYEASLRYQKKNTPLIVLAGEEYGTGSSRDWAAKGSRELGIRAVLAKSFERIHRSNLIGMGVLPLEFMPGEDVNTLGLKGDELFSIRGLQADLQPEMVVTVTSVKPDGSSTEFSAKVRIDTAMEVEYYRNGGILHMVLRQLIAEE